MANYDLISPQRVPQSARHTKKETKETNDMNSAMQVYRAENAARARQADQVVCNQPQTVARYSRAPEPWACPNEYEKLICWWLRGLCSWNKFGKLGHVKLETNLLTLPDADEGFDVGPNLFPNTLGVFAPRDWVAEAVFRGLYRVKVSFQVNVLEGDLQAADIERNLFDTFEFRLLQVGSQDNFHTALNFGDAQDAERSTDTPSQGGFWLCRGEEFVFGLYPEMYSFDFEGQAPGVVGTDSYTLQARIGCYFKIVCS